MPSRAQLESSVKQKELMRTQTLELIRQSDLVFRKVKDIKKQHRKLHLKTKNGEKDPSGSAQANSANTAVYEASRANFLLR